MSSETDALLELIRGKTSVVRAVAQFVAASADGAEVSVDGSRTTALVLGYRPYPGERVMLWVVDGTPIVVGPAAPRPERGTVSVVGVGVVDVTTTAGELRGVPYYGASPAVGASVRLFWHGGPVALIPYGAIQGEFTGEPIEPEQGEYPLRTVDTFTAVGAGTWRAEGGTPGEYQNDEVWAVTGYLGAWFYGGQIAATIPSSASIQRVELFVSTREGGATAPTFATHAQDEPPLVAVGATQAQQALGGQWVDLPVAFGEALRAGGGMAGVAVVAGDTIFRSLASDGASGSLRITSIY